MTALDSDESAKKEAGILLDYILGNSNCSSTAEEIELGEYLE